MPTLFVMAGPHLAHMTAGPSRDLRLALVERMESEGWTVMYAEEVAHLPDGLDYFLDGWISGRDADSRDAVVEKIATKLIANVSSSPSAREPRSALLLSARVFDGGFWGAQWSY